eukprot:m.302701 g.302701  ORF g.302701 m.302701 type:complete len:69 (-) comp15886_c2_seq1:943-1149(-)
MQCNWTQQSCICIHVQLLPTEKKKKRGGSFDYQVVCALTISTSRSLSNLSSSLRPQHISQPAKRIVTM